MSDHVVDPSTRYPCAEDSAPARVYLKRGTSWPLQKGTRVLYRKSESASAHWMGALVVDVRDDGFFALRTT
jgi:hypothetical protein